MLIEFRFKNYRSIRDEHALTMECGRIGEDADIRLRHAEGHSALLLPAAAIYGANASGKTNVLNAMAYMRSAVLTSFSWQPDAAIYRDPFAWDVRQDQPSLFELTFLVGPVRVQYGFCLSDDSVLEEWLYAWPNGERQVWFERDGTAFRFGEDLKGDNRVIEGLTRPNALFLSTAVQFKHPQLEAVYAWFRRLLSINLWDGVPSFIWDAQIVRMLDQQSATRQPMLFLDESSEDQIAEKFLGLLRTADLGIVDVKTDKPETLEGKRGTPRPRFYLKHQVNSDESWLPLEQESKGTRTLFRAALPIIQALTYGGVLLFDELESSLHPELARQIVLQFNNPKTNPKNSQLIFTTHDTNLLGTISGDPDLRRDQVWFTEKAPDGATVLYPLTDYKPRKAENIERGYIQGRFGAIPFLGNFTILSE